MFDQRLLFSIFLKAFWQNVKCKILGNDRVYCKVSTRFFRQWSKKIFKNILYKTEIDIIYKKTGLL